MKQIVPVNIDELSINAGNLLDDGYHCSEAVMQVLGEEFLPDYSSICFRMTNGFCGGVGSTHGNMCGAFTAGVMLLGALRGRQDARENDEVLLQMVREFRNGFITCFGTLNCQELIDKKLAAGEPNCRKYVEGAVRLLIPYLN